MADKIDQLEINSTTYDIDLPVDATPSIASLTASGNISAATFNNKTITTALGSDDTTIPTSKAVSDAISSAGGGTVTSVGAGTGLSISGTPSVNPTVNIASGYKLLTTTDWQNDSVYTVMSFSTVAGSSTSGSVKSVRWYVSGVEGITTPYNGMKLAVKIPLAGVSTGGVILSINGNNDADYHPVAYNVNTVFTTHFAVNTIKYLTYDANQTMACYKTAGTSVTITGVWKFDADYDSNTTTTYGTLAYYLRPYAGETIYRYKFVMFDKDNRLVPLTTTNVSTGTAVTNQTPTTSAFRPEKIYWYNTYATINAGSVIGGNTLLDIGYNANSTNSTSGGGMAVCNFNETVSAYRLIYLCGTYNTTTGLFTLRDAGVASSKNYYKLVPTNTANITLSSYFTSGYDYILLGGTYSSNNYIHLMDTHPMYHFDGTNLVPYDTYNENRIESNIPTTYVSTVNGSSGAITNVAKTNADNNFSTSQTFTSGSINIGADGWKATLESDSSVMGKNHTYTFPDASGTLALTDDIPSTYLKSASASGNTLTLTKQDNTTVTFTPTFTDTNYYPSRSYSSGLQISTSSGVANTCALYVPYANDSSQSGVVSTSAQTFYGTKTFTTNGSTPVSIKSNGNAGYIEFKNSSNTVLGYYGVNSSNKPVFYDTSNHELAYKSDVGGIHEKVTLTLDDPYNFKEGSGKVVIASMQGVSSYWDFNLECNGDTVASNIVYAEIMVSDLDPVGLFWLDYSGNYSLEAIANSWDTIDTWQITTQVGFGYLSVNYIGEWQ